MVAEVLEKSFGWTCKRYQLVLAGRIVMLKCHLRVDNDLK